MTIKELKPELIWGIFDEITNVPRPSKKEGKIREFLIEFAKRHNIEAKTDAIGNVAMRVPATPGKENAPVVVLQGHMDMVPNQTKPETHNFETDPIETEIDGEWVHSKGYKTTLGADNGIGMAGALAALVDKTYEHGPLEALFTVDEETGLTGAKNVGKDMMTGNILINLDSEDEAQIFLGCAGGIDTIGKFHYTRAAVPAGYQFFTVSLLRFKGGHSGSDIHLGRANANKLLARFLYDCYKAYGDIAIADINGGELRNVIPGNSYAVIGIPADKKEDLRTRLNNFAAVIETEYKGKNDNNICYEAITKLQDGEYLPSIGELNEIIQYQHYINYELKRNNSDKLIQNATYFSSTPYSINNVWTVNAEYLTIYNYYSRQNKCLFLPIR